MQKSKNGWPWTKESLNVPEKTPDDLILPKISIVTPSYNQGKYIEETIRTVLLQGYPNLEYVVMDGGSKDDSVEIIKKYQKWLTFWVSEPDRGQSHAINKGFERCTGDIVAWINSDDIYVPRVFEFVAQYFMDNPDVDMIYGDAEIIDEYGKTIIHRKELPFDRTMGLLWGFGLLIPQPSAFWRRDLFAAVGYLDESRDFDMDIEFWGRIALKGTIEHVGCKFSKMRYHPFAKTVKILNQETNSYQNEYQKRSIKEYQALRISKIIPYEYSWLIRYPYRIKRILLRLLKGHYFYKYKFRPTYPNK